MCYSSFSIPEVLLVIPSTISILLKFHKEGPEKSAIFKKLLKLRIFIYFHLLLITSLLRPPDWWGRCGLQIKTENVKRRRQLSEHKAPPPKKKVAKRKQTMGFNHKPSPQSGRTIQVWLAESQKGITNNYNIYAHICLKLEA